MKLPAWLRKPDATVPELEAQLANAQALLATAMQTEAQAQDTFDNDPSTERLLLDARAARQSAAEHVGRAERLLAAGRERQRQAELEQLRERVQHLRSQFDRSAVSAVVDPLYQAEIEALEALAHARCNRLAQAQTYRKIKTELASALQTLNEPPRCDGLHMNVAGLLESSAALRERLERRLAELAGDPVRDTLSSLVPQEP